MLKSTLRHDSFIILRDRIRWQVALVLGILIMALMPVLAVINTRQHLPDTARLAWFVFAAVTFSVVILLALPRRLGGTIFFSSVGLILLIVPIYGLEHGRNMQHWAFIVPPLLIFLLRPGASLALMLIYGVYVTWTTALLLPMIEVVRFAGGYGLMVCFMASYALLQDRAAQMLRYHSDHDALSNCLNRRTFNEAINQLSTNKTRYASCDFLLLDIDHFKAINDQHGHLVGDRIITQVAAELGRALRPDAPLFRYGGEEFAIMLVDAVEGDALALAERLRGSIGQADFQGVKVTISIGVARWRAGGGKVEATLQKADEALYAAKHAGRNRVILAAT